MVIAMSIVSVIIAVVVPVALAAFTTRRFKVSWTLVLYGAMAFIVAYFVNLFISNEISTLIKSGKYAWMNDAWFPIFYALGIGLMTGLLEQGANWLAFKFSGDKGENWGPALGIGLGHGGMESIYVVGIPLLLTLIQVITLQSKGVESLNLSAADTASVKASLASFFATPWHLPLAVGVERVLSLVIQVTAAVLTWLSFRKMGWKWFAAAVGLQTVASAIGMMVNYAGLSVWAAEGVIFLLAAISGYILFLVKTRIIDHMPAPVEVVKAPEAEKLSEGKSETKSANTKKNPRK